MQEMDKTYAPQQVDEKWYTLWEEKGYFHADPESERPPFSISLPPPNVTGSLHMGHAFQQTLSDVLIRYKRMNQFEAMWLPGTDHAGIATQTVVEKHLMKTEGKKRKDYEREEFLSHVWQWKEEKQDRILSQLRKLGSSLDWERLSFTMDEPRAKAVKKLFKRMFDEGLIYQGDYLVNWDPVTQTAIADDEVEYEDQETFLWHFRYRLKNDPSQSLEVATTRPETILGDTAVAVSPKDPRFKGLIGQEVLHPVTDQAIPIVADPFVDPEFGTGVVKITPAHDPNDYQVGERCGLPFINIMTPDGHINENGGSYQGLTMLEAREAIVKDLGQKGLFVKKEPYHHRVGLADRSRAVIEPYISKQWFVKMGPFKERLRELVESGEVQITPKSWKQTYFHWIDNLRDWCISRQLWWGHRIPIWYNKQDPSQMICYDGEGLPPEVEKDPSAWEQDEDVLDTWFSSGLWPFSTLGWPEQNASLEKFFPNSVLITGHDILFFWVARMMMMSDYAFGKPPFKQVFLHGIIFGKSYWQTDSEGHTKYLSPKETLPYELGEKPVPKGVQSRWEKMSKTKGNVIDPLELIEDYGTDAVRMALCASCSHLPQIDLDRRRFEDYKNFTNKVWNGARFVMMSLKGDERSPELSRLTAEELAQGIDSERLQLEDYWILSSLNRTIEDVRERLETFQFDQATSAAYSFFWKNFCAYYVEISKPYLFLKQGSPEQRKNKQRILATVLLSSMRLLHPMAPFITEEIFSILQQFFKGLSASTTDPYTKELDKALASPSCMVAPYPVPIDQDNHKFEKADKVFGLIERVVYSIRNIRGEMKISPGERTDLYVVADQGSELQESIKSNEVILHALTRIGTIHYVHELPENESGSTAAIRDVTLFLPIPAHLLEKEKLRLEKEKERLQANFEKISKQLENPQFVERAPQHLVEKQRSIMNKTLMELKAIEDKLN